ncbi:MAG: hypothetical protein RR854_00160 [Muribaculaceae bacterium]
MALLHEQIAATGIAALSMAPMAKLSATTLWSEKFYTLKDTVSITQDPPTKNEIKVDQKSNAVAVSYESGNFTIEFDIPDIAKELIQEFYDSVKTAPVAPSDTEVLGIKLDNKITKTMLKIDFASGQSLIIPNCEMVPSMAASGLSTSPVNIHITATALAAIGGATNEEADVIFFYKKKAA